MVVDLQMPCLAPEGLQVFTTTADQRYQISPETFLRTHFPMAMRRFRDHQPPTTLTEGELLGKLLDTQHTRPGNRVFLLYGAAGSGKSELLKWLEVMIEREDPAQAEMMIRVARTELDVLRIAERFKHTLSDEYFAEVTHRRWEEARRKPRTLAKLLVLMALEQMLDSDDEINALYYRLLEVVQPNIERSFAAMDATPGVGTQIELFTRKDLERIKEETVLSVPLEYEPFRHAMLTALRNQLLEGLELAETLQLISANVSRQRDLRPVLLVDDLVQSLNLFASDLMDYFITLDAGNWDVVVGLTPASFEGSERGRELLARIAYLDTIDDRVEKLWLSDERGHDSYFLSEANCVRYAARYLSEYRRLNRVSCSAACPAHSRCLGLGAVDEGTLLAPFNTPALVRIFRALPDGKGKARYFTDWLRDALAVAKQDGGFLPHLADLARVEFAVEHEDEELAQLAALYGPLLTSRREIVLSASLLRALGCPAQDVTLSVEPLLKPNPAVRLVQETPPPWMGDPERETIKAWLDGPSKSRCGEPFDSAQDRPVEPSGLVNRQLLGQLRRGIARWLRAVCPADALYAEGIARPHRVLRWTKTYLDVRPPIILEGVDEGEGIPVSRDIGHAAFRLHDYAKATGDEAKVLARHLTQDERLLPLLFAVADYRRQVLARLETQSGMPADELSLRLYVLLVLVEGPPDERPPGFGDTFWAQIEAAHARFSLWGHRLDERLGQAMWHLFEDFFKLRDNVYDGLRITRLLGGREPGTLLDPLVQVDVARLDKDYRLGGVPLKDVLTMVQETIRLWRRADDKGGTLSPAGQALLDALLAAGERGIPLGKVAEETRVELREKRPGVYAAVRVMFCTSSGKKAQRN